MLFKLTFKALYTLNSNLILLIPIVAHHRLAVVYPLNSNLILLIPNSVPKMVEKVYQGERGMAGALKEPIQSDLRKNLEAEIKKIVG